MSRTIIYPPVEFPENSYHISQFTEVIVNAFISEGFLAKLYEQDVLFWAYRHLIKPNHSILISVNRKDGTFHFSKELLRDIPYGILHSFTDIVDDFGKIQINKMEYSYYFDSFTFRPACESESPHLFNSLDPNEYLVLALTGFNGCIMNEKSSNYGINIANDDIHEELMKMHMNDVWIPVPQNSSK